MTCQGSNIVVVADRDRMVIHFRKPWDAEATCPVCSCRVPVVKYTLQPPTFMRHTPQGDDL